MTRKLTRPLRHRDAAHAVPRAQRREARPKLLARLAEGAGGRAGLGRRHAADLRSRLQAGARGAARPGFAVTAVPGASAVLAALSRRRAADRPVLLRGLPAAEAGGAAKAHRRARARFRRRWSCSRAGRASPTALADLAAGLGAARGGDLPRADQAARGGPARRSRSARRGLRATAPRRAARFVIVIAPPRRAETPRRRARRSVAAGACARLGEGRGRRGRARDRPAAPRGLSARARTREGRRRCRRDEFRAPGLRPKPDAEAGSASGRPPSAPASRRKAAPPRFWSPRASASWRGAGRARSARSTSSRGGAAAGLRRGEGAQQSRRRGGIRDAAPAPAHRRRGGSLARDLSGRSLRDIRFDAMLVAPGKLPRHIAGAFET